MKTHIPKALYKYLSLEGDCFGRAIELFDKGAIYFSTRLQFNDPWDSKPVFRYRCDPKHMDQYFLKLIMRLEPDTEHQRAVERAGLLAQNWQRNPKQHLSDVAIIQQKVLDKHGLYCLSATRRHPLLWSHYAAGHRGICIAFSTNPEHKAFCYASKVKYQRAYPVVELDHSNDIELFERSLLTKSKIWSYEKEWRLSYKDRTGLVDFPTESLHAVTFGALVDPDKRAQLSKLIRKKMAHAKIYDAVIDAERYSLDFREEL